MYDKNQIYLVTAASVAADRSAEMLLQNLIPRHQRVSDLLARNWFWIPGHTGVDEL